MFLTYQTPAVAGILNKMNRSRFLIHFFNCGRWVREKPNYGSMAAAQ
jgi:hypothetical protein